MSGGRPTNFTKEKKDEIFDHYADLFRENQKVPPKSDPIWNEIKKNFNLPKSVSPAAIYSAMLLKFNQIVALEKKDQSIESNKSKESNTSIQSLNDSKSDKNDGNVVEFIIKMTHNMWQQFKPVETVYKRSEEWKSRCTTDRKYKVLQNGLWTYNLSRAIARQRKDVPCRWCFKRSKVYPSEFAKKYITVHGYCNTCGSELEGHILNEPKPDAVFVDFHLKIAKIDYVKHDRMKIQPNVKIDSSTAQTIYGQKENHGKAAVVHRKLLRQSVDEIFQAPVERVPSMNAIRCTQYRQRKARQVDSCPIKSLDIMKQSEYKDWIQMIGCNPFYVSYVNTESQILYNVIKKKKKKMTIYCDATGGIAKKILRENGEKSKQIFLYTFVIADNFEVPIYSMLSEVHTMSHVTYWFQEFVRIFKTIPNEFICDMSTVLLNAAAKTFAGCANINDYVDWLFNLLKYRNGNGREIKCFIRIDVAHFIKNLTECDGFKGKPAIHKQFYVRSTCLLVKCQSLEQAELILTSILVVAKSSAKGEAFLKHKQYIDNLICNDVVEDEISNSTNEYQKEAGGVMDEEDPVETSSIKDWLTAIQRSTSGEALENSDGTETNDLENPQFVKFLSRLCESFVIWSGVAAKHFGSTVTASSAHAENYFKQIKKYMEHCIPGRVDEIVAEQIEIIDGIIIDASQKYIEFVDAAGGKSNFIEGCQANDGGEAEENQGDSNGDECADERSDAEHSDEAYENDSNGVQFADEVPTADAENSSTLNVNVNMPACAACQNGDEPGGAHRCKKCSKKVHPFEGCSIDCGEEEGYGQKRICVACAAASATTVTQPSQAAGNAKAKSKSNSTPSELHDSCVTTIEQPSQVGCSTRGKSKSKSISKELNETEKWSRRPRNPKSYLAPVKNWNIDKKVQDMPKILMLMNASLSTTVHTIEKEKFALRNTCGPDAALQVI